jgi:prepilin-type N-terminal cleavage/methylation domain-containing protein
MQTAAFIRPKVRRAESGLSLVELLLAIMILGILGSLAMMMFGNGLSQEAERQRDRRNAQEIANMAAMAGAAGAPYFVADDEEATVGNLRNGSAPSRGIFKNRVFKLPAMSDEEIQRAMSYLVLNDTDLIYDSAGGQ